jgi:hypothetical protein
MQSSSGSESRGQWEDYVEQAREKLPAPPPGIMDAYVKWIPWIAIVFGVFGLLFSVVFALLGTVFAPFLVLAGGEGLKAGMSGIFAVIVAGVGSVLSIAGGIQMKQMKANGWWLYAIGLVVGAVGDLASFTVFGLGITLALAWIHIHVRPRYF